MLPDFTWSRSPETPMLELDTYENPFRDELIHPKPELRDGSVAVPTGPGLGIEIDERVLKKYLVE